MAGRCLDCWCVRCMRLRMVAHIGDWDHQDNLSRQLHLRFVRVGLAVVDVIMTVIGQIG